jgi:peptide/nickel transport system substrate-binding protein
MITALKRHLVLAFALIGLTTAGAAAEDLTIGMSQFPPNFNPLIEAVLAKEMVLSATQRPLTVHDQDWQPICMLCTRYPTLENGLAVLEELPDGSQGIAVTYEIQPGATWGDGVPVTSADAVFTWEVGSHPQSGVSNAELYRRILSVEVIDDKTFVLHRDRVEFEYGSVHDFKLLPAHLERPIFEADPAEYRNRSLFETEPANPGLAFGPYRISEVVSGSKVVLERNQTWWGKPPAFDRVTFRVIENTAALEANLLSGAIDMIAGELGLTIDQAVAFEKRHGSSYDIIYKTGLIYEHLTPNLDKALFQDIRMRQALLLALDREAINERLFDGRQPVADTSVSPLDWIFSDDTRKYRYDPEAAKALLDEMGWTEIKGGIRHNEAGERLTFEINTTAGQRLRELVQQVLQSQWRQVGIDARIRNEPARVLFGDTVPKRNFSGITMFAWVSSPENVPRTVLHSDQIPSAENNWSGQNISGYRSAEMDALLERIEVELDREKRAALWADLQRLYAEELPALPLFFRADAFILPNWLKGVRPSGHQGVSTLWIEDWTSEGR